MAEKLGEDILNVVLATGAGSRAIEANPETILARVQARPDVIALFRELRRGIEGKMEDAVAARPVVVRGSSAL